MKVFPMLVLMLLSLGSLASVGAEGNKSFLRSNKEVDLERDEKAEGEEAKGGIKPDRQLLVERGDPGSSSVHHRPTNLNAKHHVPQAAAHSSFNPSKAGQRSHHVASASAYATANQHRDPNETKANQEAARYHTSTAGHHSTSIHSPRPSNDIKIAKKSSKKSKAKKGGNQDDEEDDEDGIDDEDSRTPDPSSEASEPLDLWVWEGGDGKKSGEAIEWKDVPRVTDYFDVTDDFVNSIPASPHFYVSDSVEYIDVPQFGLQSCVDGNMTEITMLFWTNEDSIYENEISLIKEPRSENSEYYPIGSFKTYGEQNLWYSDYYIAVCVPRTSCYEFSFLDVHRDFKDAKVRVWVDDCYYELTGDDDNNIQGWGEPHSVSPYKYVLDIGICDR